MPTFYPSRCKQTFFVCLPRRCDEGVVISIYLRAIMGKVWAMYLVGRNGKGALRQLETALRSSPGYRCVDKNNPIRQTRLPSAFAELRGSLLLEYLLNTHHAQGGRILANPKGRVICCILLNLEGGV